MIERKPIHTLSVLQLVLGTLVFLTALLLAGLFLSMANVVDDSARLPILSLAWLAGLGALVSLPPLGLAARRLAGKPLPPQPSNASPQTALRLMLLWPMVILAGYMAAATPAADAALAALGLLGLALPLAAAYAWLMRGLRADSAQRAWGAFSFGYGPGLFIILLLESIFVLIGLIGGAFMLSLSPQWMERLMEFASSAADPTTLDLPGLTRQAQDLLANPAVQAIGLAFVAFLMPLVEELFKPLAVWGVLRRGLSARTGFQLGMLSGAVFGFIESGVAISQFDTPAGWTAGVVLRAATALLHLMLSALVGYGIGAAVEGGSGRLFFKALLASVALHGLWNAAAIVVGFNELSGGGQPPVWVSAVCFLLMAGTWLYLLKRVLVTAARLRAESASPPEITV